MFTPSGIQRKIKRQVQRKASAIFNRSKLRKSGKKMSTSQQKMYFRRRVFVCVVLFLIVSLAIFCVISLGKGLAAVGGAIAGHEVDVSRKSVPEPRPVGLTPRCTAHDINIELSVKSQNVPMGGSVELTERFVYEGNTSCLIDASDMNSVLSVNSSDAVSKSNDDAKDSKDSKNGKDAKDSKDANSSNYLSNAVWRSDTCDTALKPLLMAKGDHFEKKITWNTNTNAGKGCTADEDLPKVDRGTYVLRVEHKRVAGLHSEPLFVNVR
ncbi:MULTISPECIES: peptide ABC transporter permease [unclassified Gardnerella]|uniref:peptide ABC transporter permease n=1 Tax=unclassified Gardnerella TaxID=2628112 RepID=UPI00397074F2